MSRKVWIIFVSLQGTGVVFSWISNYALGPNPVMSGVGVGLLVSGNLLLFPGSLVALIVVQKVLVNSSLSLNSLSLMGLIIAVSANLAIWLLWSRLYRSM